MVTDEKTKNFIKEYQKDLAVLIKKYDFVDDLDIIETVIMMIRTTNAQRISMKIIKQRLKNYISNHIKEQISKGNIKTINNILNRIMPDEKDSSILIKFGKKLSELNLELDADDYINIINNNETINKLLEEFIANFKETANNEKIVPSGIKNQKLLDMIEIYCSQNEIKMISNEELLCTYTPKEDYYIDDSTRLYIMEINKIGMLTKDEEEKYTTLSHQGDPNAKKVLTESNLRLVVSIANRYVGRGMELLDLIQEGNIGLIKAINRFDPSRGNKFSTYATWWIRQAITRAIGNKSKNIRIPINTQEAKIKIENAEINLINELGRYPSEEEVAVKSGISVKRLREIKYLIQDTTSLYRIIDEDEEFQLSDIIGDPNAQLEMEKVLNYNLKNEILSIFGILTQRERETLILRYGLDGNGFKTLKEVGNILGINYEGVHHHELHAKEKLKNNPIMKQMRMYINYN